MRVVPYKCEDFIVQAQKPCVPCYKKKCTGEGPRCMRQLDLSELKKKLGMALSCAI